MLDDGSHVPLASLVKLFCILLVAGIALTIPLYKFQVRRFISSNLFIKIMFWIPIFLIFLGTLYADSQVRLVLLVTLLIMALRELIKQFYKSKYKSLLVVYFVLFAVFLAHFYLVDTIYQTKFINILITLAFATVLADVTAFFFGNYFGIHKLPPVLNKNKSWEGVSGEIVGALVGVLLVNSFIEPVVSIWLFLPIGIGSVTGDLANSYVKRKLDIKDWSRAIPGHGGFIDRLSSIAGSVAFTFYFLKITGLV